MKTKEQKILFTKEQVWSYIKVLGDTNPVYQSEESAQELGFRTIPIPPAMPMTVYQLFDIPWTMQPPVIHRKQKCVNHRQMYIGEEYTGYITLSDISERNEYTFSKQTLYLYDQTGDRCFTGISHNVSGEIR